ncbi:hypothetical protein E7T09_09155 [Deinococcus sp. KSM4-11]|uniref:hypothetical protein n=1 Tax=Deinococcus sp. KSM4-11 TaxID=2568654 RepID=UPI0010A4033A|nr:hypothetical protein [Deinococcus sp. KSM4-11]THF87297.1 hypothetical protein E7T09_09155 [Deinococcus sp. KSM4-11]
MHRSLLLLLLGSLSTVAGAAPLSVALAATDQALPCGAALTPALTLSGTPPTGTQSVALIFWDQQPRALSGRWLVYDLPLGARTLRATPATSLTPSGGKAATNEAGKPGYTAICSKGKHDIYVDFYAIDVPSLNVPAGTPLQRLHALIKRHKLLEAKAHLSWTVR